MCGLAGFMGLSNESLLSDFNRLITHRGPDDSGHVTFAIPEGRVGLVHRRLSIIDLSAEGRQPMTVDCEACGVRASATDKERLWLAYNGEIYNYRQLRAELKQKGHRFHSQTDSEVLLHLYAEDGPAMLGRLNGIFAFAIYDGRPGGQTGGVRPGDLLLVRDGLGVKPLYYAEIPDGFLFASELKALLACPDVSRELDLTALHCYLAYLWAPAPLTPLKAVRKFEPGEAMIVRGGRMARRWTFYEQPYGRPWLTGSEEEIAAELRERLAAAVERQLVADVPVGAFLSGGLDSSSVVAMMRKLRPADPVRCYSIGFAGDSDVEGNPADLPYARRVAGHLGVDLRVLEIQPDAIRYLDRMLYHLDEPQADPAPINALLIAEQASRDGIKVLMSGAGGDDIFSGYRRHWALTMEKRWLWLPRPVRERVAAWAREALDGMGPGALMRSHLARRALKTQAFIDLPDAERLASYFLWSGEGLRRSLYSPRMAQAVRDFETLEPLKRSLERIPGEHDPLNRMLYLEARHFLADHNLNYTDKTSMASGVEVRVPLLDLELVDFAARIPPGMKQKGAIGKAIFKKAMEPHLPSEVIYRPKSGFGAPLRRWLHRELRPVVEDVLSPSSLRRRDLFDPVAVRRLVDLDQNGRVDGAYTIFSLICIELWCRMFIDGQVPSGLAPKNHL